MSRVTIFWFRRDLRLDDNAGLFHALSDRGDVQGLFIFDTGLLKGLPRTDARVHFIHQTLESLKDGLQRQGADLWVRHGDVLEIWDKLSRENDIAAVYANHDYEPSARRRDEAVARLLEKRGVEFKTFKDQCLFEKSEILNGSGKPYTVFTPYKKKVLAELTDERLRPFKSESLGARYRPAAQKERMPTLRELGFEPSAQRWAEPRVPWRVIDSYDRTRDFLADEKGTTRLGPHLRFGTLSVRALAKEGKKRNATWLSELIWRDFFMQILWHFPFVETRSFREAFERVEWRKSKADFDRWREGRTGYPLVDAGMRELNATGFMHNRARMVTASFLTKHLLIHWREGERYFAEKLLDYDLAANNGNWQWAAGTGCDAAPYFRVFNPETQAKRFDPDGEYVRRWVPEAGTDDYPAPMIDHAEARGRALRAFHSALKGEAK